MDLTLSTSEKASIDVALQMSDGSTTPLGVDFGYEFAPNGIATIANQGGTLYILGVSTGETTLDVYDSQNRFHETVTVTVTPGPPPVTASGIVVTLGAPEPK